MRILFSISVLMFAAQFCAQSLDTLLIRAVQNHPELKALEAQYEAHVLKAIQVQQLPDPQLGIGIPVLRPETRLGPQLVALKGSQMFPWFGTQNIKKDIVLEMSKAKFEKITLYKLELFHDIRTAYYKLQLAKNKRILLTNHLSNFRQLRKIVLSKIDAGESGLADVLRIEMKINQLKNDSANIENDKSTFSLRIHEALGTQEESIIQITSSLDSPAHLQIDSSNFRIKIQTHHPMMLMLNAKINSSKKKQELTNKMGKPMIGIGLDYTLVGKRTDMNPDQNGRDIIVPKAMITLPLNRKKYEAKVEEETLHQLAFKYEKESLENRLMRMLKELNIKYIDALEDIDYLKSQQEISKTVRTLLLAKYSANGAGFDELLSIQNELYYYDYQIQNKIIYTYLLQANVKRITEF